MGTKSRESIYGASVRAAAEQAADARRTADRLACEAWNKQRMLGFQGPAQPSPTLGDALNAGYLYLEVKCLGCSTHQTVPLNIVRRPKSTPIHELERYMRCKARLQGRPYKRSHLIALRATKISANDPASTWWAGRARLRTMCNLYSITTNQAAIAALFRIINRYVGNLPPMPGVFPAYPAPVVRNVGAERELAMMRWGMPPPPRTGGLPVTNIRNTSSPHWRGWLKPVNRCLVPANSFAEYAPAPNPETKKKDVVWFALNDDRPLFAFAGIWTTFNGDCGTKSKPVPGPHQVYGFLTTSPNAVVEPIHPKACRSS
jgi:putative SOS response-associated peptidase YedK